MASAPNHPAPKSAEQYELFLSKKMGDSATTRTGLTIATAPKHKRHPRVFINLREHDGGFSSSRDHTIDLDRPVILEPDVSRVNRAVFAGSSGAGKSHAVGAWVKKAIADQPQDVFVISNVSEDKSIDSIPGIVRLSPADIVAEMEDLGRPLETKDFDSSIVIFDDVEQVTPRTTRAALIQLRDMLLQEGRHEDVQSIAAIHTLLGGHDTKKLLQEATIVTLFPRAGATAHIQTYLKTYIGFSPAERKRFLALNTRAASLSVVAPRFVVHDRGAYLV